MPATVVAIIVATNTANWVMILRFGLPLFLSIPLTLGVCIFTMPVCPKETLGVTTVFVALETKNEILKFEYADFYEQAYEYLRKILNH